MACGEYGPGRLPEIEAIVAAIGNALDAASNAARNAALNTPLAPHTTLVLSEVEGREPGDPLEARPSTPLGPNGETRPLAGKRALVTAGPTHEPIDPVRYIANRSSGKQGFAIAGALARLGANVTLIAGPVVLPTPAGVSRIDVETAIGMAAAVEHALPTDVAVMVAAVADWRTDEAAGHKIKKAGDTPPTLTLTENPDILAGLGRSPQRPSLLIGFAAETQDVIAHASAKRERKGADWIVANDVSGDVMGGDRNAVHIVTADGVESWPDTTKDEVADRLAIRIAAALGAIV
jgi:phosphopantothenoylcysteine decarboxylase/phosphopantothenate--cysteine ligase